MTGELVLPSLYKAVGCGHAFPTYTTMIHLLTFFSVFRGMEDAGETQSWVNQDALNPAEEGGLVGTHAC